MIVSVSFEYRYLGIPTWVVNQWNPEWLTEHYYLSVNTDITYIVTYKIKTDTSSVYVPHIVAVHCLCISLPLYYFSCRWPLHFFQLRRSWNGRNSRNRNRGTVENVLRLPYAKQATQHKTSVSARINNSFRRTSEHNHIYK